MVKNIFTQKTLLAVGVTAIVNLLVVSIQTWASESPMKMIQTTVEQSMAVLEDPAYQGDANFQKRIKKLEDIVLPRLDSMEFSRRALGVHWRKLTDSQRQEFIDLFKELIEKSYGGTLDRYSEGVRFSYNEELIDGKYAEVHTGVTEPAQNKQFTIVYRLNQRDDKWLIYDVVIENVSMVSNYRHQFNRILTKSSFEELTKKLREKIQQLDTAPAS